MCGIVAVAGRDPVPEASVARATAALRHRGPDSAQTWASPDRRAGLGHARLSIIDLATGGQPIANEDGSVRIVANGEFYDFERIQRELVGRGHRLRTKSDSEIALHLYEEEGAGCLRHLRGEFAFAVWEESSRTLFAARDRFGIKPLFYAEAGGSVYVASEVKALAAAGIGLAWDHESVAQNLFSSLVGSRTLFRGVHQVPPGHYLTARDGQVRLTRYWDLDYPGMEDAAPPLSDREWIEGLRERLREAVRLRMRADVPVGCLLSGGLDSSATLGMAREFTPGPLKAFTIAFDHPDYDESAVARESAGVAGADFLPIRVTDGDFAAVFPDVVRSMEGLCLNTHTAARYLLSRSVREAGVKVVLAGEGADEMAAGYRFFESAIANPVPTWRWPVPPAGGASPTAEQAAAMASELRDISRNLVYPRYFFEHRAGRLAEAQGLYSAAFARTLSARDPHLTFFGQLDAAGQLEGREAVRQAFYLWMKSSFANYVLCGERLDMAHGIEQRLPFLDHELFGFARSIPSGLLMRDGREKWILREAVRPFVTERVYEGRKRPFVGPPYFLSDGSAMLALAQDRLRSSAMADVPFFEHRAVVGFLDRLGSLNEHERSGSDPLMLLLLSCSLLQDAYRLTAP